MRLTQLPNHTASTGFTLIELIMTILVMAIATVGMVSALSFGLKHQSDAMPRAKIVALAQAYFDEIMAKRYDEASPIGGLPACSAATTPCSTPGSFDDGESRANFDDVDDFDGLDDQPPRYADGTVMTNYDGFRVQISVTYPTAAEAAALGVASTNDAKLIEATIRTPDGNAVSFAMARANF